MIERKTTETTALAVGGAAFLAAACFFLWRDLSLPRELLLLLATVVAGGAALLGRPLRWPTLAPAALLAMTAVAGAWFLATKSPALLPSLGVGFVTAALAAWRGAASRQGLAHDLRWYALGATFLAGSWAAYFSVFTVGVASESVVRRLIPTLAWLAVGLALIIAGRLRAAAPAHVGLGLVAVAIGKAAFYDTTHLAGLPRVAVLAAVGVLLLAGARLLPAHAKEGA